jgi:ATP-binding cassette subfamily B multidrug efflux pump
MFGVIVFLAAMAAFAGLAVPYLQKRFVDVLAAHDASGAVMVWIVGAFVCAGLAQTFLWLVRQLTARESAKVQRALGGRLYDHMLNLQPQERGRSSVGELVTYFAQDVSAAGSLLDECVPNFLASLFPLLVAPLSIGLVLGLDLWPVFGVAALGILVTAVLAWRQAALFVRYKQQAQDRLGLVNEWVQNIKLLRVSGRVGHYEMVMTEARQRETLGRMAMVTNASVMNALSQYLPHVINLVGLGTLTVERNIAMGRGLSPGEIFGCLWVLGIFLGSPLRQLPWAFVTFVDGVSSITRLQEFFDRPTESLSQRPSTPEQISTVHELPEGASLWVKGLRVAARDGEMLLSVDELRVESGEMLVIVGPVGAGKSLLVSALLGDVEASFDEFEINGQSVKGLGPAARRHWFAAVPQQGFIMNANLRHNVLLEYGLAPEPDAVVFENLTLAEFDPQNERLEGGLDTALGERGVNLSGGQRQRLNLARAALFDRPIVVLDDALAAVDGKTAEKISASLVHGRWRQKTRLVVSHRIHLLDGAQRVLYLCGGRVAGMDTVDNLLAKSDSFRAFFANEDLSRDPVGDSAAAVHRVIASDASDLEATS